MSITDTLHSGHLVTAHTFFVESAESNQTLIENPYIADRIFWYCVNSFSQN